MTRIKHRTHAGELPAMLCRADSTTRASQYQLFDHSAWSLSVTRIQRIASIYYSRSSGADGITIMLTAIITVIAAVSVDMWVRAAKYFIDASPASREKAEPGLKWSQRSPTQFLKWRIGWFAATKWPRFHIDVAIFRECDAAASRGDDKFAKARMWECLAAS